MAAGKKEVKPTFYDVPVGAAESIWSKLWKKDQQRLPAVSKGLQALFAPAVTGLLYTLEPDDEQQATAGSFSNMFPGLHPDARPSKMTIRGHNWHMSVPSTGDTYAQSMEALVASPQLTAHNSQLRCLCLIAVRQSKLTSVLSEAHPLWLFANCLPPPH
jgi:hypothetical protein